MHAETHAAPRTRIARPRAHRAPPPTKKPRAEAKPRAAPNPRPASTTTASAATVPAPSPSRPAHTPRLAGARDAVDLVARLPAELQHRIYAAAGHLTELLHGRLGGSPTQADVDVAWAQCLDDDLVHLVPLLPKRTLSWELLFVRSERMLLAVAADPALGVFKTPDQIREHRKWSPPPAPPTEPAPAAPAAAAQDEADDAPRRGRGRNRPRRPQPAAAAKPDDLAPCVHDFSDRLTGLNFLDRWLNWREETEIMALVRDATRSDIGGRILVDRLLDRRAAINKKAFGSMLFFALDEHLPDDGDSAEFDSLRRMDQLVLHAAAGLGDAVSAQLALGLWPDTDNWYISRVFSAACANGRLATARALYPLTSGSSVHDAVANGHMHMLPLIQENPETLSTLNFTDLATAGCKNAATNLAVIAVLELCVLYQTQDLTYVRESFATGGNAVLLEYAHGADIGRRIRRDCLLQVIANDHTEVLDWIHANGCFDDDVWESREVVASLDSAVINGATKSLRWFKATFGGVGFRTNKLIETAIAKSQMSTLEMLLDETGDANLVAALDFAVKKLNVDAVEAIVARPGAKCSNNTCWTAIKKNSTKIVRSLLRIRPADAWPEGSLDSACAHGYRNLVALFVKHGIEPTTSTWRLAALAPRFDVLSILVLLGCEPDWSLLRSMTAVGRRARLNEWLDRVGVRPMNAARRAVLNQFIAGCA
ncbi:hypothetical protein HK105_203804 [Polyrhizophydium stewartii]|uniref:Ankyrin repeat protein n=1 Tax=Polyrhizophydium stewartii TaxID=2732419 RepID=A0ABR4NAZ4_9FUNG